MFCQVIPRIVVASQSSITLKILVALLLWRLAFFKKEKKTNGGVCTFTFLSQYHKTYSSHGTLAVSQTHGW